MNNRVIDRKQQRARAIKYEKIGLPDFDRPNNPFCWRHVFLWKWMKFFSGSSQVVYVHDKDQLFWKKATVGLLEATKDTMIAAWVFSFRLESCACALIFTIAAMSGICQTLWNLAVFMKKAKYYHEGLFATSFKFWDCACMLHLLS